MREWPSRTYPILSHSIDFLSTLFSWEGSAISYSHCFATFRTSWVHSSLSLMFVCTYLMLLAKIKGLWLNHDKIATSCIIWDKDGCACKLFITYGSLLFLGVLR
jgi:hypothetical protein